MDHRPYALTALLIVALPACSITLREPEVQPLNPLRTYADRPANVCEAVANVITALPMSITADNRQDDSCLIETDYRRINDTGEELDRLRDVAYVGNQNFFSHGRFLLTVAIRSTGETTVRVRITSRIEGYDAGYQHLRSTGQIENAVFDRLSEELGSDPLDG